MGSMSAVPISQLSKAEIDELACTYAAMILYDDGLDVDATNMNALIKASGCTVEGYWPTLFAKLVNSVGVANLMDMSSGAGGGPSLVSGPPGAGGGTGAEGGAAEAKKEEKVEEEEEEEDV